MRDAFRALEAKNVLGLTTYEVLIKEYLVGEYVVDCVSRDGVAIWKYDKRVYNASPSSTSGWNSWSTPSRSTHSAQFFLRLVPWLTCARAARAAARVVTYTLKVLDAIGIRHGAMHCEIVEPRTPC